MSIFGRRSHLRFTLGPASDGVLRVIRDVMVESSTTEQITTISRESAAIGELLSVQIVERHGTTTRDMRVADCRPLVNDGALRHRIRLEQVEPGQSGPADRELTTARTTTEGALGILTRDFRVELLNFSPSGCLLESSARLPVGTIGMLSLRVSEHELFDNVRVVRCQPIAGAGELFHLGGQFLWTAPPGRQSLRLLTHHEAAAGGAQPRSRP